MGCMSVIILNCDAKLIFDTTINIDQGLRDSGSKFNYTVTAY